MDEYITELIDNWEGPSGPLPTKRCNTCRLEKRKPSTKASSRNGSKHTKHHSNASRVTTLTIG